VQVSMKVRGVRSSRSSLVQEPVDPTKYGKSAARPRPGAGGGVAADVGLRLPGSVRCHAEEVIGKVRN
jgi:hypothetical protein